jgi:hypothetical protein
MIAWSDEHPLITPTLHNWFQSSTTRNTSERVKKFALSLVATGSTSDETLMTPDDEV